MAAREQSDTSKAEDSLKFWKSVLAQIELDELAFARKENELVEIIAIKTRELDSIRSAHANAPERLEDARRKVTQYERHLYLTKHRGKVTRMANLIAQMKILAKNTTLTEAQRDELYKLGVRL